MEILERLLKVCSDAPATVSGQNAIGVTKFAWPNGVFSTSLLLTFRTLIVSSEMLMRHAGHHVRMPQR